MKALLHNEYVRRLRCSTELIHGILDTDPGSRIGFIVATDFFLDLSRKLLKLSFFRHFDLSCCLDVPDSLENISVTNDNLPERGN